MLPLECIHDERDLLFLRVRGARVRVCGRERARGHRHGGERPGLLAIHLFRLFRQTFGFPLGSPWFPSRALRALKSPQVPLRYPNLQRASETP